MMVFLIGFRHVKGAYNVQQTSQSVEIMDCNLGMQQKNCIECNSNRLDTVEGKREIYAKSNRFRIRQF